MTRAVDELLLTIALCATSAWCANDGTLTRNARTIDLSSWFAHLSLRSKLWKWSRSGAMNFESKAPVVFGPEDGERTAVAYQRQYGYRGEWLIEQLGNGLGPGLTSLYSQPVPDTFLTPPLPSLR